MKCLLFSLCLLFLQNVFCQELQKNVQYFDYMRNGVKSVSMNGIKMYEFVYKDGIIEVYNPKDQSSLLDIYYHGNNIIDSVHYYPSLLSGLSQYTQIYSYDENGEIDYVYYEVNLPNCIQYNLLDYEKIDDIQTINKYCTCDTIVNIEQMSALPAVIKELYEFDDLGRIKKYSQFSEIQNRVDTYKYQNQLLSRVDEEISNIKINSFNDQERRLKYYKNGLLKMSSLYSFRYNTSDEKEYGAPSNFKYSYKYY